MITSCLVLLLVAGARLGEGAPARRRGVFGAMGPADSHSGAPEAHRSGVANSAIDRPSVVRMEVMADGTWEADESDTAASDTHGANMLAKVRRGFADFTAHSPVVAARTDEADAVSGIRRGLTPKVTATGVLGGDEGDAGAAATREASMTAVFQREIVDAIAHAPKAASRIDVADNALGIQQGLTPKVMAGTALEGNERDPDAAANSEADNVAVIRRRLENREANATSGIWRRLTSPHMSALEENKPDRQLSIQIIVAILVVAVLLIVLVSRCILFLSGRSSWSRRDDAPNNTVDQPARVRDRKHCPAQTAFGSASDASPASVESLPFMAVGRVRDSVTLATNSSAYTRQAALQLAEDDFDTFLGAANQGNGVPKTAAWLEGRLCTHLAPEKDLLLCVALSCEEYPVVIAKQLLLELEIIVRKCEGWEEVEHHGLNEAVVPKMRELMTKYGDPSSLLFEAY